VERVADRIAVLDGGVLQADCTVETFRQQIRHFVLKFRDTPPPVPDFPGLLESFRTDREMALTVVNLTPAMENRLEALGPVSIESVDLTLEDAFISYVGERGEKTFFMNGKEAK
jgi:ABC-2 type transport system ATP-binding protein